MNHSETILICKAQPVDMPPLNADFEIDAITKIIAGDTNQMYKPELINATVGEDLEFYLHKYKPQVFHFIGHGVIRNGQSYLCLLRKNGETHEISTNVICDIFSRARFVKCVILNACYSDELAQNLAEFVPNVIGMRNKISDASAVNFARGFYSAITLNQYFQDAFNAGVSSIDVNEGNDRNFPILAGVEMDLDIIVDQIINNQVVVFIGPEISQQNPYRTKYKELADIYQGAITIHENDDLLVYNENAANIIRVKAQIEDFLRNTVFHKNVLTQISELPINLIVSATPDNSLSKIMTSMDIAHKVLDIRHRETQTHLNFSSRNSPTIFNLFGTASNHSSPVISHKDLFDYLSRLFVDDKRVQKIREIATDGRYHTLIFFGFQFNNWYCQLLLWLLGFNNGNNERNYFSFGNNMVNENNIELNKSLFSVYFIEHGVSRFVNRLHEKIGEKGKLRSKTRNQTN